eukprot:7908178-Pyramimonas_sp.AAC.1
MHMCPIISHGCPNERPCSEEDKTSLHALALPERFVPQKNVSPLWRGSSHLKRVDSPLEWYYWSLSLVGVTVRPTGSARISLRARHNVKHNPETHTLVPRACDHSAADGAVTLWFLMRVTTRLRTGLLHFGSSCV